MKKAKVWMTLTILLMSSQSHTIASSAPEVSSTPAPSQTNSQAELWGEEVEGFQLALQIDHSVYAVDDKINVKATLMNLGEEVQITWRGGYEYWFEVWRADGTLVARTKAGQNKVDSFSSPLVSALYLGRCLLQPHGSRVTTQEGINRGFEVGEHGSYSVRILRRVPKRGQSQEYVTIASNMVKVTIEAPKAEQEKEQAETVAEQAKGDEKPAK